MAEPLGVVAFMAQALDLVARAFQPRRERVQSARPPDYPINGDSRNSREDPLKIFQELVGISNGRPLSTFGRLVQLQNHGHIKPRSLFQEVKDAERKTRLSHRTWRILTTSTQILLILLTATLTAVCARGGYGYTSTVLAAISTFTAGLAAYFRGRDPSGQLRVVPSMLHEVITTIEDTERMFATGLVALDPYKEAQKIEKMYQEARRFMFEGPPDHWVAQSGKDAESARHATDIAATTRMRERSSLSGNDLTSMMAELERRTQELKEGNEPARNDKEAMSSRQSQSAKETG